MFVFCFVLLWSGRFTIQNVVPQPDGDSSKVKVKVRVNVHGIFSVSSASLIEKQKGEADDVQMDAEPTVQNEGRPEDQVEKYIHNLSAKQQKFYQKKLENGKSKIMLVKEAYN